MIHNAVNPSRKRLIQFVYILINAEIIALTNYSESLVLAETFRNQKLINIIKRLIWDEKRHALMLLDLLQEEGIKKSDILVGIKNGYGQFLKDTSVEHKFEKYAKTARENNYNKLASIIVKLNKEERIHKKLLEKAYLIAKSI